MCTNSVNELDSQSCIENVSFLGDCFDKSFSLQSSVSFVKDYVASIKNELNFTNKKIKCLKNECIISRENQNNSFLRINITQKTEEKKEFNKNLKNWGLPPQIVSKYEERGIVEMFEWQVECLSNQKVLMDCQNLVYSAPTSAGKTLVAEILAIKTVLERKKKVIVILPFVSIVREKMIYLQDILSTSGVRVEGFMGSQAPPGGLQAVHIAVCTIEKANSLINKLLDEGHISELGAVIVDELHLLGDPHRGYILELLLTKIKYMSLKTANTKIQIVGMSATLPNLVMLANWLEAELYITEFRPIPLDEYCLVDNKYYDKQGSLVRSFESVNLLSMESDYVLWLCLDTIREGCSILIFCMTKNRCENLARNIASSFFKIGCLKNEEGHILRMQLKSDSILEVLEQLKNCPVGLDQVLKSTISFGVAYHHAGLTFDERDIIEGAFKSSAIRVLVATSTLSSGVNLPARKVIIRSPVFLRQPINILTYKQMIGRAGRMGKDVKGESILICTSAEKKIGFDLMMGILDPVKSCIEGEDKFMRAILEMIASQEACTKSELDLYTRSTLLFTQQHDKILQNSLLENTIKELINFELVRIQINSDQNNYVATSLGKACLSSSMAPNDGLSLFCELQKARQCLVLETDLHLIYLVTPYSVSSQWNNIDWLHLLNLWESLTVAMKRVGELVGVQESFIIRCLRDCSKKIGNQNKMNIHKRFYTALALQELVNEVPLSDVASKFQCARGFLQGLQQSSATFAGMVTAFCHQLGWKNMELLISQFQDRLHFGIHSELLELMKLSSLNGVRARTLFDAGFETISSVASADVNTIENILHKAVPFQSEKEREGDDDLDLRKRNKMKNIWITGFSGLTAKDAAKNLVLEARKYLAQDLGVAEIKWKDEKIVENVDENNSPMTLTEIVKLENYKAKINICTQVKNDFSINRYTLDKNETQIDNANIDVIFDNNKTPETNKSHNSKFYNNMSPKRVAECTKESTNEALNVKYNCNNKPLPLDLNEDTIWETLHLTERGLSSRKYETSKCGNLNNILYTNNLSPESQTLNTKSISNNNSATNLLRNSNHKSMQPLQNNNIWESLNIEEANLSKTTKYRTSDILFSPNISFGDSLVSFENNDGNITTKTNNSNSKDISLFSSEGETSSVFDNSSPIDLIPNTSVGSVGCAKADLEWQNCNTGTSTWELDIHSKTLHNVFNSSVIDIDEEEDFKLVYEDDKKVPDKEHSHDINMSQQNEIFDTQESHISNLKDTFFSPLKRQTQFDKNISLLLTKKVKRVHTEENVFKIETFASKSKHILLNLKKNNLKCYILHQSDIINNFSCLKNAKRVSIVLEIKSKSMITNHQIGGNILQNTVNYLENKEDLPIHGIAFCLNENMCLYLDLTTLENLTASFKLFLSKLVAEPMVTLMMTSVKSNYLYLKKWLGTDIKSKCVDITLFEWLLDSDEKISKINDLTRKYLELDLMNIPITSGNTNKTYESLDASEVSCIRAWCIQSVAEKQKKFLETYRFMKKCLDVETQVSKILGECEFYGIVVDKNLASKLLIDVKNSQEMLQKKAYKICGYHFNFNSSKDVAKVLGLYKGRKISTRKSVLSAHNSPMASIVIYWRKLNSILTKTLYPLTEEAFTNSVNDRINPVYTVYTCTGRISMHEPNLQNVPRTFSVPVKYLSTKNFEPSDDVMEFNCRSIFKAAHGYVFVSADYCQLEMRILTHYSKDAVLSKIMRANVDVFNSIASSMAGISEADVDYDLRQNAKQLCYGILYGMGNRTLAQQLDISEIEAAKFMDTFYKTYPAIKGFTRSVIEECRKNGYVETLMKRRRYLPDINSNVSAKRSAAERQAVNTTIQGSAADIAKAAMCAVDDNTNQELDKPRLVLQMHDELIYEVKESMKLHFIKVLKDSMQETVQLNVPLPVKVKNGYSWGAMEEVKF